MLALAGVAGICWQGNGVAMAGDWIPMRTNLQGDPAVVSIARATKLQPDSVVGKLHCFWAWADSHTADGTLHGIDEEWIDELVRKKGFAAAMTKITPTPWLIVTADGVIIPNFENWFGTSAKRRLMDTKRKQVVRNLSADCPHGERTKTGPPNSTIPDRRVLAPALGGADFQKAADKARTITEKLGSCGSEKNKRLLLGACLLSEELGEDWLRIAVTETRSAQAQKPYAYLRTVLQRTADELGVNFEASVAAFFSKSGAAAVPMEAQC